MAFENLAKKDIAADVMLRHQGSESLIIKNRKVKFRISSSYTSKMVEFLHESETDPCNAKNIGETISSDNEQMLCNRTYLDLETTRSKLALSTT